MRGTVIRWKADNLIFETTTHNFFKNKEKNKKGGEPPPNNRARQGVDHNNKPHPKGVDEFNLNVVTQENVTMMNKGKGAVRKVNTNFFK